MQNTEARTARQNNCVAANRLYIRADGSIPCGCDVGEHVTLYRPDVKGPEPVRYIDDCYNGKPFLDMRRSFQAGKPYLKECKDCFFYQPGVAFEHNGQDGVQKSIEILQIESSFLCPIDCPACFIKADRTNPEKSPLGSGPVHLPVANFMKLVDDCVANGIEVKDFFFCGRGEPLLNPHMAEILAYARKHYPRSIFSVHTSGNVKFRPEHLMFDRVTVSIDGATQETYEQYRREGKIERAKTFIAQMAKAKKALSNQLGARNLRRFASLKPRITSYPVVCWKYVLFEHNDSEQEILKAQKSARELGADQMEFVLSHTWNRSKRYPTSQDVERDPIFRSFVGRFGKVFGRHVHIESTVNVDVDNIGQWAEAGA